MIRELKPSDVETVGRIWLEASLQVHNFVPAKFWYNDHEVMTTEMIPGSHSYVHETDGVIDGFVMMAIGERANYMGALFVTLVSQGQGISMKLLDHVKTLYDPVQTSVPVRSNGLVAFGSSASRSAN